MSAPKRSSFSPPTTTTTSHHLKHRVISCLNKLSDRDTLHLATAELESIARNLTQDSFSPFLNCIHNTDSSSKSPVRKECVNLLTLLSRSHGNMLSPHLTKMVSTVTRRLRDSDSAVRSACVEATSAMSSQITNPPFSTLWKPLFEMVTLEHDYNVQIGAAMCLAAAIEASPEPEAEQLRKVLPKLGKLVKFDGFKAKGALLSVIGSVVGVGGASTKGVMDWLVPCLVEFLSNEDWSARKAAAEALGKISVAQKELAAEHKVECLSSLESRRFDKVKIVRETMNRTLELWKELPDICEEASVSSLSGSSSTENPIGGCLALASKSPNDVSSRRPQPKKSIPGSTSPPSSASLVTTAKKESPVKSDDDNNSKMSRKLDHKKISPCRIDSAVSRERAFGDDFIKHEYGEDGRIGNSTSETKRVPFSTTSYDAKHQRFSGLKSGSRVAPYDDDDEYTCSNDIKVSNTVEDFYDSSRDTENLSLIRKQLIQIENQQSNLLSLLQRFMGHSQNGINSLEKRIHGVEMALDEISHELAISNGRISNPDSTDNSCCKLPGAEFLSSKLRRRTEDRYTTSRLSSFGSRQWLCGAKNTPAKDTNTSTYISDSQRFQHNNRSRLLARSSTDDSYAAKGNSTISSRQMSDYINRASIQVHSAISLTEASLATSTAPMNIYSW